jgi:hypothetical protein
LRRVSSAFGRYLCTIFAEEKDMADIDIFDAQTITWSGSEDNRRSFGIIFQDAHGHQLKLFIPMFMASDAFSKLSAQAGDATKPQPGAQQLLKDARKIDVGSMDHEPIVVIKFDDDIPYSFDLSRATSLLQNLRAEIDDVARRKPPQRQ